MMEDDRYTPEIHGPDQVDGHKNVPEIPDPDHQDQNQTDTCALTVSRSDTFKGGKAGEGGNSNISNEEFIAALFGNLPEGSYPAICSKRGDPGKGGWYAQRLDHHFKMPPSDQNNFINCSSFYPGEGGSFKARKHSFAGCYVLMFDDIGTKIPWDRFDGFEFTWLIETSPGNYQGGIALSDPVRDQKLVQRVMIAIVEKGLCDPGSTGPYTRWMRLPNAINGKPKYHDDDGKPFQCRLVKFNPARTCTMEQLIDELGLKLPPAGRPASQAKATGKTAKRSTDIIDGDSPVLTPRPSENAVVAALKSAGLYKEPKGEGMHAITCPWCHEHTDGEDSGTVYFEPSENYPRGGFKCHHSHGDRYNIVHVLEYLDVSNSEARHKPVIRVIAGDLYRVVDGAEQELARVCGYYQSGGLIVSIAIDPTIQDPLIKPTSLSALTREMSKLVHWERFDKRALEWVPSDPPARHMKILYEGQTYRYLPALAGLARQPYFREQDGELVTQPGYDPVSQLYGVFDPGKFPLPEPTLEAAQEALRKLEALLSEFHFVSPSDKAAALSAIFTAVLRPSLPYAPGFHVRAPVFGSGKTYLCELIGAFAGPGVNNKVSYPTTSEEATKVVLALLMTGPACIEFDDMDTDWIPHGVIKRVFTAQHVTDRILGVSKTATVSTRTLILGSGNNVGPVRDLLRRVITIHIDPRCATPATLSYQNKPVDLVRANRGEYVAAVLTIIRAWRAAGAPCSDVKSIVTYGDAWSDYCRHPLIWLGHEDPATALLDQINHDPDAEALADFMAEWHSAFGSSPTTVRRALQDAKSFYEDLLFAIRELPVQDRDVINPSKLGWYLKRNADRIVNRYQLQAATADGRNAWRVVKV